MHKGLEDDSCKVGAEFEEKHPADCWGKPHVQLILCKGFLFSCVNRPPACYMVLLCFTSL